MLYATPFSILATRDHASESKKDENTKCTINFLKNKNQYYIHVTAKFHLILCRYSDPAINDKTPASQPNVEAPQKSCIRMCAQFCCLFYLSLPAVPGLISSNLGCCCGRVIRLQASHRWVASSNPVWSAFFFHLIGSVQAAIIPLDNTEHFISFLKLKNVKSICLGGNHAVLTDT